MSLSDDARIEARCFKDCVLRGYINGHDAMGYEQPFSAGWQGPVWVHTHSDGELSFKVDDEFLLWEDEFKAHFERIG